MGILKFLIPLLLAMISATLAQSLTLEPPTTPVKQYEVLEFRLSTDQTFNNPFDDNEVKLELHLTTPDDETIIIPAFWYQEFDKKTLEPVGEPYWLARFTPMQAGDYTAQAFLNDAQSERLEFTATAATSKGFVRIHRDNTHYFAFDEGSLYVPIGINLGWWNNDPLSDYERWLDALSENGGNFARVWMSWWAFGIEWNDTPLGDYSNRLRQAWLLDQVLKMAQERGIYIMVCFLNHGAFSETVNPEWNDNPYNVANGGMLETPQEFVTNEEAKNFFKHRVRYVVSRYAAYTSVMSWEWWNEANWTPIFEDTMRPWLVEMTAHLKRFDPYGHLVTTSYADGNGSRVWEMDEIDFAQDHKYTDQKVMMAVTSSYHNMRRRTKTKPVLLSERGYRTGGADDSVVNRDEILLHNGLWLPVFRGFGGTGMYWWWDTFVDPRDMWFHFKGISEFLKDEDLTALTPMNAKTSQSTDVSALSLQNENRALVWLLSNDYDAKTAYDAYGQAMLEDKSTVDTFVYAPPIFTDLTVTIEELTDGDYKARWFDPQTAQYLSEEKVTVRGGEVTLNVPAFNKDIALKLE